MSIASELTRLQGVKSDILTAIGNKGVTVPADAMLDDCPTLIGQIETGGGSDDMLLELMNRTITSIDIPSGVTSISDYFFTGCSSLASITLPSSLATLSLRCFSGCGALTSLDFRSTNLTTIGQMAFYYCTGLTEVYLPSTVTSIVLQAFRGCANLTKLVILATTPPSAGVNLFMGTPIASGTGYIYVPYGCGSTYQAENNWSDYANQILELDENGNIPT